MQCLLIKSLCPYSIVSVLNERRMSTMQYLLIKFMCLHSIVCFLNQRRSLRCSAFRFNPYVYVDKSVFLISNRRSRFVVLKSPFAVYLLSGGSGRTGYISHIMDNQASRTYIKKKKKKMHFPALIKLIRWS